MGEDQLGIESNGCAWAVPGTWTSKNFPCGEGGDECDNVKDTKTVSASFVSSEGEPWPYQRYLEPTEVTMFE